MESVELYTFLLYYGSVQNKCHVLLSATALRLFHSKTPPLFYFIFPFPVQVALINLLTCSAILSSWKSPTGTKPVLLLTYGFSELLQTILQIETDGTCSFFVDIKIFTKLPLILWLSGLTKAFLALVNFPSKDRMSLIEIWTWIWLFS